MARTVGEVAALAKVSVRTLHHYDEIGLLSPTERSAAGYRLYGRGDLERLQQVLLFKELGLPLDEIRCIVTDPGFDPRAALVRQRALLAEKARHASEMAAAVEAALAAMERGTAMSDEEMFEVFGDFDPKQYEEEVVERWGDTDAYKESARRTKSYTKADWEAIRDEGIVASDAMVAAMEAGLPPESPEAMDAAELARLQIDKWFYPCSREMHRMLGEMYVADPRFTATYEKIRPGMARYVRDAIRANAERAGG